MGLEAADWIDQMVPTNPTGLDPKSQGDDHINLIKRCVLANFPALGQTACTATADELSDVANKLISFNGRTAVAAVPTQDDYSLDMLQDMGASVGAPDDGDFLKWTGSNWSAVALSMGSWRGRNEFGTRVGDSLSGISVTESNWLNGTIGQIGQDGSGFFYETQVDHFAHLGMSVKADNQNSDNTHNVFLAIGYDSGTTIPLNTSLGGAPTNDKCIAYGIASQKQSGGGFMSPQVSAFTRVQAGRKYRFYCKTTGTAADISGHQVTIFQLAIP